MLFNIPFILPLNLSYFEVSKRQGKKTVLTRFRVRVREKKLCWWDSNPAHVYVFYKQEDIKLFKNRETKKTPRDSPF